MSQQTPFPLHEYLTRYLTPIGYVFELDQKAGVCLLRMAKVPWSPVETVSLSLVYPDVRNFHLAVLFALDELRAGAVGMG